MKDIPWILYYEFDISIAPNGVWINERSGQIATEAERRKRSIRLNELTTWTPQELTHKSDEILDDIIAGELHPSGEPSVEEIKTHLNSVEPDYKEWMKFAAWDPYQSACLVNGVDPDAATPELLEANRAILPPRWQKAFRLFRSMSIAHENGKTAGAFSPGGLYEHLSDVCGVDEKELCAFKDRLGEFGIRPKNYKQLYEQSQHELENLKKKDKPMNSQKKHGYMELIHAQAVLGGRNTDVPGYDTKLANLMLDQKGETETKAMEGKRTTIKSYLKEAEDYVLGKNVA